MSTLTCTDPQHVSEDRPECDHPEQELWEEYVESTRVRICLPCQAGDHRACDPEFCDCAHSELTATTPTKEGTPA